MNKESRITLVIASASPSAEKVDKIQQFANCAGCPVDVIFYENNRSSLTEIYQQELEESTNDVIVFTHDDIEALRDGWGAEVLRILSENPQYGILGVAGCKCYGMDGNYKWWDKKNNLRGMIFHGNEKNSWLSIYSPYNTKSDVEEVSIIDGVFMACVKSRLHYGFDTNIKGFHFYDIDFCISNFGFKDCKIGVTNKICLRHDSDGMTNEQWEENGKFVIEKHKNKLPLKIFK